MAFNLLDLVKDQVSGQLAKQASGFLGESESNVQDALGGIFPSLLGSMISSGTSEKGAAGLMDMIGKVDMNSISDIGSLFGGGASSVNGLLNSGGGMVESLLGDKMGGVIDMISKVSGIGKGSSSSLIKMAAPFLMGMIGKKLSGGGVSGLMDLLMGQKEHVAKQLPAGMGNVLGLGSLMDFGNKIKDGATGAVGSATRATTGAVGSAAKATTGAATAAASAGTEAAKTGLGWIKWALPLLLIGGVAWWLLGGKGGDLVDGAKDAAGTVVDATKDAAGSAVDATKDAAGAVADAAKGAFATVDEAARAALDKVTFAAGSVGSQMMDFIDGKGDGDGVFRFENLTFNTASAEISGESGVEVDNLAAIMKAYPDLNIEVHGHTDTDGDDAANMTLSQARAAAVEARLIAQGIDGDRVSTKGFGETKPVASNDTAEGKAQNRRIEVMIVK